MYTTCVHVTFKCSIVQASQYIKGVTKFEYTFHQTLSASYKIGQQLGIGTYDKAVTSFCFFFKRADTLSRKKSCPDISPILYISL